MAEKRNPYCTARCDEHACRLEWLHARDHGHPGDGTDHECHCGETWINDQYQDATKPQFSGLVSPGWWFGGGIYSNLELGPVFQVWFWRRGIHFPLRWRPWRKS